MGAVALGVVPPGHDLTAQQPRDRSVALALPRSTIEHRPGRQWRYNNYHPLLLGVVLERATGRSVARYLSEATGGRWAPKLTADRLARPHGV